MTTAAKKVAARKMAKKWMQLRTDAVQYAAWKRAAAADGRTLSAWVRRALDAQVKRDREFAKAVRP